MSGCCGGGAKKEMMMENFNAGNPPLGFGGYPGSEFPGTCGGGTAYGGYGHYGTYGGCPTYDHYDKGSEYDAMDLQHDTGCCGTPMCQTPYSVAYSAKPKDCSCAGEEVCGTPMGLGCKKSGNVMPKMEAQPRAEIASVSADVAGQNLVDVGLLNGSDLTAYAQIPFFGVSVNIFQLVKYIVLFCIIVFLANFLFGFKLRL